MINFDENLLNVEEILRTLKRHLVKLVAYNLLVICGVVAIMLFWPRSYRSEAKIWLKIGRENSTLDPTITTGERISIQETDREDEIKSVIDILAGRGVAGQVVDQLSPDVVMGDAPLKPGAESGKPNPIVDTLSYCVGSLIGLIKQIDPISRREEAIIEIVDNLRVGAERKSNVISVAYEAKTPELAQAIVQVTLDRYREEHARIHHTNGSHDFFGEQRAELEAEVFECAEKVRLAKGRLGIASLDGQRNMLEAQLLAIRSEKLTANQRVQESLARKKKIAEQMADQPLTVQSEQRSVPNTGRDALINQLYGLQVERMALESKMSPSNPKLQALKEQEAQARRELEKITTNEREESTQSINAIHQQLSLDFIQAESSFAGYEALLKTLEKQETELLTKVEELNVAEVEIRALERDLGLAEATYANYAKSMEVARIDEALDLSEISNISVAQSPTLQEKPVSPSKGIVAFLGVAAMGFGSLTILSGLHLLRTSSSGQNVEPEIALPPVVTVPHQRRYRRVDQ